tara:strand:+ start:16780 stop:17751 length:972 start_codon:yes stop_codon:yes gene_type:complete
MPNFSISKNDLIDAHQRIEPYIHRTPILTCAAIDELANCSIFFKCENFQKIGAFKMRGATNALLQLNQSQLQNGVTTHSSGNHAQAVAKAAQMLGVKAFIVMPKTAPKVKIAAVEAYGGKITFCEPTLAAREDEVAKLIEKTGAEFIPPYDDAKVIAGQASAAKELIEEHKDLDAIICPVGGGGLLAGTILSAHYFSPMTKVYAGEPEGADDAYQSFLQKKLIPQKEPKSIADGLLTSLGKQNFEIILEGANAIFTVNDSELLAAMRLIWERMKIIIEPSCAVPFAAVLKNKALFENKKIGIILSGGNVDLEHYFKQLNSISF